MNQPHHTTSFGDLRALLHGAPSPRAWEMLCAMIDEAPDSRSLEDVWLPYIKAQLSRWPDTLRTLPEPWRERWRRGAPAPELSICAAIDLADKKELARLRHDARLTDLTTLRINARTIGSKNLFSLLHADHLRKVRSIDLYQGRATLRHRLVTQIQWDEHAASALYQGAQDRIEHLGLALEVIEASGIKALLEHPDASSLKTLSLAPRQLCNLDEGLLSFQRARHLVQLSSLSILRSGIGAAGVRALIESPSVGGLEELVISGNRISSSALVALLSSPLLDRIEHLGLDHTGVTPAAITALAGKPRHALARLDLGYARFDMASATALAAQDMPALARLSLANAEFDDEDEIAALLSAPWMTHVEHLNASNIHAGDLGVRPLLGLQSRALRALDLRSSWIDDEFVAALGESAWREVIEHLWLDDNHLTGRGIIPLLRDHEWPSLVHLGLSRSHIEEDVLRHLLHARMPALQVLDVSGFEPPELGQLEEELRERGHMPALREIRNFRYLG